jgi:dethiobiotin synthetase
MMRAIVVAGTDTDVGKTVFAAALAGALDGCYWKPVQCGTAPETDTEAVRRLSGLPPGRVLPEAYRLALPASPHLAAEREGIEIDVEELVPPEVEPPLIIEPAGGLMVPLNRRVLQIELIAKWALPVVLVASTRLGTINHSLLSLDALRSRSVPLLGIAFVGDANADSECMIAEIGGVRLLGRLPRVDPLNADTLRAAFEQHFDHADFLRGAAA